MTARVVSSNGNAAVGARRTGVGLVEFNSLQDLRKRRLRLLAYWPRANALPRWKRKTKVIPGLDDVGRDSWSHITRDHVIDASHA